MADPDHPKVVGVPPTSVDELLTRARNLEGRTLGDLATSCGVNLFGRSSVRDTSSAAQLRFAHVGAKGKPGALMEMMLGATGGSASIHDFPSLGVELKTIPIDARGIPLESTYVCVVPASEAERAEWATSWARAKLSNVLFVPIRAKNRRQAFDERVVGKALMWQPTADEDAALKADFEEIMGAIALGAAETLTAHVGQILQCRPKARDGSVRMRLLGPEGEVIATVPRGFYLRPAFTGGLLAQGP